MKTFIITIFLSFQAFADENCKPCDSGVSNEERQCVLKKYCKSKKVFVDRVVEKTVEKTVVKETYTKNNVSILLGGGPRGNIREETSSSGNTYHSDNGAVLGVQYSRNLDEAMTGLIQLQTNRTFLLGIGADF